MADRSTAHMENRGRQIILVGGGRMGTAMLHGWLTAAVPASRIAIIEPTPGPDLLAIVRANDLDLHEGTPLQTGSNLLFLAVKPQIAQDVARSLQRAISQDTMVVSIMAGVTIAALREMFPEARGIIRAMPNIAAAIGKGVTVATHEGDVPRDALRLAEDLFSATGLFEWLANESQIDAASAISGSGPARLFYFVECLTDAGVWLGLGPESAERIARETAIGAGNLLDQTKLDARQLRQSVTSPGGTTVAALNELIKDEALRLLIRRTAAAAAERSRSFIS